MATLTITNTTTTEELISWITQDKHRGEKGKLTQQIYTNLLAILQQAPNGVADGKNTIENIFKIEATHQVSPTFARNISMLLIGLSKGKDLMRYMACYVRGLYVKDKPKILGNIRTAVELLPTPEGSPSSPK